MERSLFENDHYNSYYYANIVDNVLSGDIELIGFISEFKELHREHVLMPFEKFSAFHSFIKYLIIQFFIHDMHEHDLKEFQYSQNSPPLRSLYAEHPLRHFDLEYDFKTFIGDKPKVVWEDIEDYHDELQLTGYIVELAEKLAHQVFYILFNNRELLMRFNIIMSDYVSTYFEYSIESEIEEAKPLFKNESSLKRVGIPEWVKKAVFFRDRGHCCGCERDLTGLVSLKETRNFAHIVPLAQGGLNDVSNIQLLCAPCNSKKSDKEVFTSDRYEKWY